MTISIIIPVYNEALQLDACLQAIARQTATPYEVIVVDNNSSDNTVAATRRYPFVTLLHESRQGVVHARNRGFNAAKSDIIARIDADTLVSPDWLATIQAIMADDTIAALSGAVSYHDFPKQQLTGSVDLWFRQRIARGMGDEVFLYGANMAIRRSVWRSVRHQTCAAQGMHEDFDLAIHIHWLGAKVVFDQRLRAAVSLRRFDSRFGDFWHYATLSPKTYALHGLKSQWHMYPVIGLVVLFFWPIKLLYKGYDSGAKRFLWSVLLTSTTTVARVNPATFVD